MKILIIILTLFFVSCTTTKYITVPMSAPPQQFEIQNIDTQKEFIKNYQESIIKIAEWQVWYNIQVNSNYFNYSNR